MELYFPVVKMENGGKFYFICVEFCKMNYNVKTNAEGSDLRMSVS